MGRGERVAETACVKEGRALASHGNDASSSLTSSESTCSLCESLPTKSTCLPCKKPFINLRVFPDRKATQIRHTVPQKRGRDSKESEKSTMQTYEELSLLIESVEDDLARAVRSGNVVLARQFAQELRARFTIYRDACADVGIAWAIRSQRVERCS
jgi:hypothetical protein